MWVYVCVRISNLVMSSHEQDLSAPLLPHTNTPHKQTLDKTSLVCPSNNEERKPCLSIKQSIPLNTGHTNTHTHTHTRVPTSALQLPLLKMSSADRIRFKAKERKSSFYTHLEVNGMNFHTFLTQTNTRHTFSFNL